jgi:hypothetical protein
VRPRRRNILCILSIFVRPGGHQFDLVAERRRRHDWHPRRERSSRRMRLGERPSRSQTGSTRTKTCCRDQRVTRRPSERRRDRPAVTRAPRDQRVTRRPSERRRDRPAVTRAPRDQRVTRQPSERRPSSAGPRWLRRPRRRAVAGPSANTERSGPRVSARSSTRATCGQSWCDSNTRVRLRARRCAMRRNLTRAPAAGENCSGPASFGMKAFSGCRGSLLSSKTMCPAGLPDLHSRPSFSVGGTD